MTLLVLNAAQSGVGRMTLLYNATQREAASWRAACGPIAWTNLEARSWQKWFFSVPSGWQATLTFDDYSPYGPAGSRLAVIFAVLQIQERSAGFVSSTSLSNSECATRPLAGIPNVVISEIGTTHIVRKPSNCRRVIFTGFFRPVR